jgi:serine/threonine protein kinase
MRPELWRKAEDLFHAALEQSPEERRAFLENACGQDSELRRQVEILVAAEENAGSFLDQPGLEDPTATIRAVASLKSQQFGHYRIKAPLGKGGMGEVYRAQDTKLSRDVALKMLPSEFARDRERVARFRREARTLAALNHPNIAAIYGLEEFDGTDFLVLELVEGKHPSGPLPVAEALRICGQIADALAAAHDRDVIHRDLKPANVMVNTEGRVKVLDFGLAKAISRSAPGQQYENLRLSHDPSLTQSGTISGGAMGTPGYMSPEQARGRAVDRRTDIWAFGCVLYELLAGKRAFRGHTTPETLAAVLEEEPDWQALPAKTPRRIRELLRRCLQKDPDLRPADIDEARKILEAGHGWNRWMLAGVSFAALAVFVALAWRYAPRQSTPARAPIITRLTTDSGLTEYPALSPDGKLLAYASDRASDGNLDIWVQQSSGGNSVRLTTHSADDVEPAFSPDSTHIAFRSERDGGGIYVVPILGGQEQRIAGLGRNPRFSPDGNWIAYWIGDKSFYGRRQVYIVPATGGEPRAIQPGFFFASHPVWSPDSKHLLFRGARDGITAEHGDFDWWASPLDGSAAVQTGASRLQGQNALPLTERNATHGGWGVNPSDWADGFVSFSAASGVSGVNASLWKVPISSSYRIEGPAQRLTSGTENVLQPSAIGNRIAFASVTQSSNIWSLPADPNTGKVSGDPQRLTSGTAEDTLPAPSLDGKNIVFASNRTGKLQVWRKDVTTGAETRQTSGSAVELPLIISPDGSRIVYCIFGGPDPQSSSGCFIASTGGGEGRNFCQTCNSSSIQDWFDHGRKVLYKKGISVKTEFVLRDLGSGAEATFLRYPMFSIAATRFSPDERWVSFQVVLEAATRRQIFIAPVRNDVVAPESEWIPVTDGSGLDRNAVWSPDGNLLYFLSERDGFRCIWAQRLDHNSKHPVGEAFPVHHLHQTRRSLMPFQEIASIGLSVTRNGLVFSVTETIGNIWVASFE